MIYSEMNGRLGNQMFRYAMARWLQIKYYSDQDIVMNFLDIELMYENDQTFKNELINFNITPHRIYKKKERPISKETTYIQKLFLGIVKIKIGNYDQRKLKKYSSNFLKYSQLLNSVGVYFNWAGYHKPLKSKIKSAPIIVHGFFESNKYFDDIRSVLLEEFTPKYELLPHNIELMEIINDNNSVCISIRRGDYITNKEYAKYFSIVNRSYFENAIEEVKKRIEDPVFILFSDDVEWAKSNIDFKGAKYFSEKGDDPVWEKLRLMYSCKHFIISNSTFSWWAQYLGRNPQKIVISPERWTNTDFQGDLLMDDFIKVGNEKRGL